MTMQQRENTVYNVAWYSDAQDNTKGPLTILPKLEEVTNNWSNVNDQTYTMGTTNFNGTNAYTGCRSTSCTTNTYTLGLRTGKARMITIQETNALGCAESIESCPIFMNNYLWGSTSHGGTVNDQHQEYEDSINWGYWTMSAESLDSNGTYDAWFVTDDGDVAYNRTVATFCGARAVVVINKSIKNISNSDNDNKNNSQVVDVKDTLKYSYIGYIIGSIILILGVIIVILNYRKNKTVI